MTPGDVQNNSTIITEKKKKERAIIFTEENKTKTNFTLLQKLETPLGGKSA